MPTPRHVLPFLALATLLMSTGGCAGGAAVRSAPTVIVQKGKASYYHDSLHGRPTASGALYDRDALTAAHRSLPFGTEILVRNLENGKSVRVTVNDRGPFVSARIVDLSRRAAEALDFVSQGVVDVIVEVAE